MTSLIIVGAGAAGAPTALAAIEKYDEVYLIDGNPSPSIVPASQGLQRIVRASYPGNEAYERLAAASLKEITREGGPLSEYFHETERYVLEPGGTGPQRKTFRDIEFEKLVGQYDNQPAGRIDAADALKRIKEMAEDRGVKIISGRVTSVVWDDNICRGVRVDEVWRDDGFQKDTGSTYLATKVLLAMGYQVPDFLARQGKQLEDGLCQVALVTWAEITLTDPQYEELKEEPITIVPGVGEFIQAPGKKLLVNNARTAKVKDLEEVVRKHPLHEKSPYYRETHDLVGWFLPNLKDPHITIHYCLDLITANQQFLIRPVPRCQGLYVACGFSFHGFKFVGIIGSCVVQMMEEQLDPELQELWSGKLDKNDVHPEVMPQREFGKGEL